MEQSTRLIAQLPYAPFHTYLNSPTTKQFYKIYLTRDSYPSHKRGSFILSPNYISRVIIFIAVYINYSSNVVIVPLIFQHLKMKLISNKYSYIKLKWERDRKRKRLAYTNKYRNITSKKKISKATIVLISVIVHKVVIAITGFLFPLSILYFPCLPPEPQMLSLPDGVTQTLIPEEFESSIILPVFSCYSSPLTFTVGHGSTKRHLRYSSGLQT